MNKFVTFLIPCKKRLQDLKDTIVNIYQQAERKNIVHVRCIIDKNDPILEKKNEVLSIHPNITFYINDDLSLKYLQLSKLYYQATENIQSELFVFWGDRVRINTFGFDKILFFAFMNRKNNLFISTFKEIDTWNCAYPIITYQLNKILNYKDSVCPDGFIRYIAETTNIHYPIHDICVERFDPQNLNVYATPGNILYKKEKIFRLTQFEKKNLINNIQKILNHPYYRRYTNHIADPQWFTYPYIMGGPIT